MITPEQIRDKQPCWSFYYVDFLGSVNSLPSDSSYIDTIGPYEKQIQVLRWDGLKLAGREHPMPNDKPYIRLDSLFFTAEEARESMKSGARK